MRTSCERVCSPAPKYSPRSLDQPARDGLTSSMARHSSRLARSWRFRSHCSSCRAACNSCLSISPETLTRTESETSRSVSQPTRWIACLLMTGLEAAAGAVASSCYSSKEADTASSIMVQGLRGTVRQPVSSRNRARLSRRGVTNVLRDGDAW